MDLISSLCLAFIGCTLLTVSVGQNETDLIEPIFSYNDVSNVTDETRLINAILTNYNPAARPVFNASHKVTVKFGITLTQISDMVSYNYISSVLTISFLCLFSFPFLPNNLLIGVSTLGVADTIHTEIFALSEEENRTSDIPRDYDVTNGSNIELGQPPYIMANNSGVENQSKISNRPKIMSQGIGVVPDEQLLMERLMIGYHRYSRPVVNASFTVLVKFGLTLVQISDMDEVNQVLTINVWLEQEWDDERLTWDPTEYNNLKILRIPCEKLWLPDIVLYNSADDYTTGYMNSKAMVSHTGNVFWPPPARFRSSCKIDITYFPFDDQKCELKFGSWTYDGFQVDITNRSAEVDLQNYVYSGEWELIDVRIKRMELTYACCIEPYPDVRFTIVIRRKTLYYLFNIIFPCLWLTILSLLGFWLPPDSGEKITLGITVLLAFSVFMLLIAESMPATSEFVPLIGIYLTVTMGMTSMSIILTVFVLQLHHVGPHKRPVPAWLRTLVIDIGARLVCMSRESQPFLRHKRRHHKLQRYVPAVDRGGEGKREDGKDMQRQGRRYQVNRSQPRLVVDPCMEPGTKVFVDDTNQDGFNRDRYDANFGHLTGGGDVGGSVYGENNMNMLASVDQSQGLLQLQHPQATETVNAQSTRYPNRNNCNGEAILHQRSKIAPTHCTEITAGASLTPDHGTQCQEFSFHPPHSPFYSGQDNRTAQRSGFTSGLSPSVSFRSRCGSFRRDNFQGSFRAGVPVFNDAGSSLGLCPESVPREELSINTTQDPYQQLVMEWQFVAHVMDRVLFWLFLFIAFVSSIAILVIKPLYKPPL